MYLSTYSLFILADIQPYVSKQMVDGTLVLRSGCPCAPRPYAAGPLCTALSSFRQIQRRSTPRKRQSPLLAREEIGREMTGKFCLSPNFHVITEFFNMPQICDRGRTALLPFRRKACWGFFCPKKKIRRIRPGLNPRTWVPEVSMLCT
jgi:hypothetical protein